MEGLNPGGGSAYTAIASMAGTGGAPLRSKAVPGFFRPDPLWVRVIPGAQSEDLTPVLVSVAQPGLQTTSLRPRTRLDCSALGGRCLPHLKQERVWPLPRKGEPPSLDS